MNPTKWDLVLDQKPMPLVTHLLEQVAVLFARDLSAWPPHIEAFDAATVGTLEVLLAQAPLRPDPRLFVEAFTLARFDLERDFAAYDDHMRNSRWLETGLTAKDKPMLLFLSRFITEQLLGLAEATEGRLKRPQLIEVLERTQRHFFATGPSQ